MINKKGDVTVEFFKIVYETLISQGYEDDSPIDILLDLPGMDRLVPVNKVDLGVSKDKGKHAGLILKASREFMRAYFIAEEMMRDNDKLKIKLNMDDDDGNITKH